MEHHMSRPDVSCRDGAVSNKAGLFLIIPYFCKKTRKYKLIEIKISYKYINEDERIN